MRIAFVSLVSLLLWFVTPDAAEVRLRVEDSLFSSELQELRRITVDLPGSRTALPYRCPVIFMLDGDWCTSPALPVIDYLADHAMMPRAVVVSIQNTNRDRDFFPDPGRDYPTGGGADAFVRFLRQELIPHVERTYGVSSHRTLVGHSIAGLFTLYAFLTVPEAFDGYIAVDPSLWFDGNSLVARARDRLAATPILNRRLFVSGCVDTWAEQGIGPLHDVLARGAPKHLVWACTSYEGEDHASVRLRSIYDGLRTIFDREAKLLVLPQSGTIVKGKPYDLLVQTNKKGFFYSLDGNEPNEHSLAFDGRIRIRRACALRARIPNQCYAIRPDIVNTYHEGAFEEPLDSVPSLEPGVRYRYYEGFWDSLPDLGPLTPVKEGVVDNFSDSNFTVTIGFRPDSFAIEFDGLLRIERRGYYLVYIKSAEGSKLFINDKLMANNDAVAFNYGYPLSDDFYPIACLVPFKRGYYPIRVQYHHKAGKRVLLVARKLDVNEVGTGAIPSAVLFHAK